MAKQNRIIPNPSTALIGVSIREDGSFENIGIGSFNTDKGKEIADRLVAIAKKVRASTQVKGRAAKRLSKQLGG